MGRKYDLQSSVSARGKKWTIENNWVDLPPFYTQDGLFLSLELGGMACQGGEKPQGDAALEDTDAQRGKAACSRLHSRLSAKPGPEPKFLTHSPRLPATTSLITWNFKIIRAQN